MWNLQMECRLLNDSDDTEKIMMAINSQMNLIIRLVNGNGQGHIGTCSYLMKPWMIYGDGLCHKQTIEPTPANQRSRCQKNFLITQAVVYGQTIGKYNHLFYN